jgi:hypothetical protein
MFQELPAPPVADLVAQQPADLVAYGRNDEHGGDVQLALAGEDRSGADRSRPDDGDPHIPRRGGGEHSQVGPDTHATARTSGGA